MRGRWWLVLVTLIVSLGLGALIAGIPSRNQDRPLFARVRTVAATSTTNVPATTTTSMTTTPPPQARAPGEVLVRVANASTITLAAAHMTTRLAGMGYQMLAPLNSTRNDLATTEVVFNPGFEPEARVLAQAVGTSQVVSADPTLNCEIQPCAGDVAVFVGGDLAT